MPIPGTCSSPAASEHNYTLICDEPMNPAPWLSIITSPPTTLRTRPRAKSPMASRGTCRGGWTRCSPGPCLGRIRWGSRRSCLQDGLSEAAVTAGRPDRIPKFGEAGSPSFRSSRSGNSWEGWPTRPEYRTFVGVVKVLAPEATALLPGRSGWLATILSCVTTATSARQPVGLENRGWRSGVWECGGCVCRWVRAHLLAKRGER